MIGRFFSVNGYNISSLIIDRLSLKFSRRVFESTTEFNNWWNKTLPQTGKREIEFDSIRSIVKEIDSDEVNINYKHFDLFPNICTFSFEKTEDAEYFFEYLTEEKHFQKSIAPFTNFYALSGYVGWLIATAIFTTVLYNLRLIVERGYVEAEDINTEKFLEVLNAIGGEVILGVGGLVGAFLLYKIWSRLNNPPDAIILKPIKAS